MTWTFVYEIVISTKEKFELAQNIYVAKTTADWLEKIGLIDQTWTRNIDGFAHVGDDHGNIVVIHVDSLEPQLYRWKNGKVISNA